MLVLSLVQLRRGALLPFRSSGFFFAVEAGSCGELALMGGVGGRRVLLPYTVYKAINHVCYVRAKVIHVHCMAPVQEVTGNL